MLLCIGVVYFVIAASYRVEGVTLEETLLTDMIGDLLLDNASNDKCDPTAASGTFSFSYDLVEPYFDTLLVEHEREMFLAEISHIDPITEQSWSIRVGKGGNIYSYRGPLGETIPPNRKSGQYMVDEVWQTVTVDSAQNDAANNHPNGKYFIHQAGIYQKDSPYSDTPYFFSPSVAHVCDAAKRECLFASWGQHAHVPTKFISKVLYISRYRDCGSGVLEFTSVVHNADNNLSPHLNDYPMDHTDETQLNYMSLPWWGVRDTVYRDVMVKQGSAAGGGYWSQYPNPLYGWSSGERKLMDTGGYTLFAENRSPRPEFIFPGYFSDADNAPAFVLGNLAEGTVPCEPYPSHSFLYQVYHVRCRLVTNVTYGLRCPGCELTFTNNITGGTLEVINVNHWSLLSTTGLHAGDRHIYFAPRSGDNGVRWDYSDYDEAFAQSVADGVNAILTTGSEFSIEWTDGALPDEENHCLTLVHGVDDEVTLNDAGTRYWHSNARLQYGTAYDFERQFMVMNEVQLIKSLPGTTFGRNQYILTSKSIPTTSTTAATWVPYAIQDFNDVGDLPGTQIDLVLSADGTRFGHVLDNAPCEGTAYCRGRSTPQEDERVGFTTPHFLVRCGDKTYFGPNVNYFSNFTEGGVIRTYICDDSDYSIRPSVKLLGFFSEGDCDALETAVYQDDYCLTEGVPQPSIAPSHSVQPTQTVSSMPSMAPTTSAVPTMSTRTHKPSFTPSTSTNPSHSHSQAPTLHHSLQPSPTPIALPQPILSLNTTFNGYLRTFGVMFDIQAINDITILTFDINAAPVSIADIEVYTKQGTHRDSEMTPMDWTKVCKTEMPLVGRRTPNRIPVESMVPVTIPKGTIQAFYITLIDQQKIKSYPAVRLGLEHGDLLVQDSNLKLFVGTDNWYYFSNRIFSPRSFNGNIIYAPGLSTFDYQTMGVVPGRSRNFNVQHVMRRNKPLPDTCPDVDYCIPQSPWQ